MIVCPICLKNLPRYRPGKWDPYFRCPCGALFSIRCRYALPQFASLGLRRCEPICLPRPVRYYSYLSCLKLLFRSLRWKCGDEQRERARAFTPLCDLIRFGDRHAAPVRDEASAELLEFFEENASSHFVDWPEISDFKQFHAHYDFASWCLERIGDGRFSERDALCFGRSYHRFPYMDGYWCEDEDISAAWKKAVKGLLPTSRRAQVRSRMSW